MDDELYYKQNKLQSLINLKPKCCCGHDLEQKDNIVNFSNKNSKPNVTKINN